MQAGGVQAPCVTHGGGALGLVQGEVVLHAALEVRGHHGCVFTEADGGVSVTEAGCPDKVCEKTGVIRHAGEIIVCVPADAVIRIPGETAEDFIAG